MQKITKRELEVLELFCYKNDEISNILNISIFTVKNHVHNILHKLEETTKIRALIKAIKMGIINVYAIEISYVDVGFWDKNGTYKMDMQRIINDNKK